MKRTHAATRSSCLNKDKRTRRYLYLRSRHIMFSCSNSHRFISSGDQDMQYGSTNDLNDLTVSVVSPTWAREKIIPRTRDAPDFYVTTGPVSRETWSTGSQAGDVPQAPKAHSPRGIGTSGNRRCARANRTPTVLDESPFFRSAFPRRIWLLPTIIPPIKVTIRGYMIKYQL